VVKRVGQNQIEGTRIRTDHPLQESQSGCHFTFFGPLRFVIQEKANRLAARARAGQQHDRYLPVVELRAIRSAVFAVYGSLQAARTVTEVTGMAFVAVQNSDRDPLMIRQRFITLQLIIDMVNALSQTVGIHQSAYAPDAVGAAHGLSEPATEEAGMSGQFQSIEAAHASPEQRCDGFENDRGRDTRLRAPVHDVGNNSPRKLKDLLGVGEQAAENGQPFLARKRFHSSSETSSIRRCISWYTPAA
jgi:hypothetical protein